MRVNLKDIFGKEVNNNATKDQIKQAFLDKILERAESGRDVDGKRFKKYSKSYIDSDDFKAFGKDPGKVNLRLTGDMLELMDVVNETKNTFTIGWDDSEEGTKAHGHITGKGNLPRRDFFGLTNKDIESIKSEFKSDVISEGEPDFIQATLLEALNRITGDGEG